LPRASFADQDGGKRLPSGRIRLSWAIFFRYELPVHTTQVGCPENVEPASVFRGSRRGAENRPLRHRFSAAQKRFKYKRFSNRRYCTVEHPGGALSTPCATIPGRRAWIPRIALERESAIPTPGCDARGKPNCRDNRAPAQQNSNEPRLDRRVQNLGPEVAVATPSMDGNLKRLPELQIPLGPLLAPGAPCRAEWLESSRDSTPPVEDGATKCRVEQASASKAAPALQPANR
jgi:hypothetical protein